MFRKIVLSAAFSLALANQSFAQIKIEGPKEGTVGYRTKAKLTLDATDPKIVCFPANDDWMAVQDLSGNKFIDFVPGRKLLGNEKSKTFTFVAAGHKDKVTFLETWEVVIKADEEVVPPPKPKPIPVPVPDSELFEAIRSAYFVSPDAELLTKLISTYSTFLDNVNKGKYSTNKAAHSDLVTITDAKLKANELTSTRDAVSTYLEKTVGKSPSGYNKERLAKALTDVIELLKSF